MVNNIIMNRTPTSSSAVCFSPTNDIIIPSSHTNMNIFRRFKNSVAKFRPAILAREYSVETFACFDPFKGTLYSYIEHQESLCVFWRSKPAFCRIRPT
jgi:hypothetical protein